MCGWSAVVKGWSNGTAIRRTRRRKAKQHNRTADRFSKRRGSASPWMWASKVAPSTWIPPSVTSGAATRERAASSAPRTKVRSVVRRFPACERKRGALKSFEALTPDTSPLSYHAQEAGEAAPALLLDFSYRCESLNPMGQAKRFKPNPLRSAGGKLRTDAWQAVTCRKMGSESGYTDLPGASSRLAATVMCEEMPFQMWAEQTRRLCAQQWRTQGGGWGGVCPARGKPGQAKTVLLLL